MKDNNKKKNIDRINEKLDILVYFIQGIILLNLFIMVTLILI